MFQVVAKDDFGRVIDKARVSIESDAYAMVDFFRSAFPNARVVIETLQGLSMSVVTARIESNERKTKMSLFQINVSRTATSGKTAHYFRKEDYNVVLHEYQAKLRNGEIFDFEVVI